MNNEDEWSQPGSLQTVDFFTDFDRSDYDNNECVGLGDFGTFRALFLTGSGRWQDRTRRRGSGAAPGVELCGTLSVNSVARS